eukprot:CAMPEP_0117480590 /NCGR_PEP_ID=MMETSP0784-20121206/12468_1 /TAXON_ID=39447 /ORGANISM="" /LENGTH=636 /DNA_ID=CAMNT_0005275031 /DNA_START=37 /DNA_END=1947 /DNA_ORIENTATION=+
MTSTELRLKRERLMRAFRAGRTAICELELPYFLAHSSAQSALCDGQFSPHDDDIFVGVYAWDLAALQRRCPKPTSHERDRLLRAAFEREGFKPVKEMLERPAPGGTEPAPPPGGEPPTADACPRVFLAELWDDEQAFPICYKFSHRETGARFVVINFSTQFGYLWDFADGGAETSSGWKYTPFAPQPLELQGVPTHTMPELPLREHFGQDWHLQRAGSYVESLATCENRCQVLRVLPFDVNLLPLQLPKPLPAEDFRKEVCQFRMRFAKASIGLNSEVPARELDLFKIESKPAVLFDAAGICKSEGNDLLKGGEPRKALDRYEEGLLVADKAREVLLQWRLVFWSVHAEKAEKDRKDRGLKQADLKEPAVPRDFRADEAEERACRLALLLNAAQAALQSENWEVAEARATAALELDPRSAKALYRRGLARERAGRAGGAKEDFWTLMKVSDFQNKDALQQLLRLLPRDEVQSEMKRLKVERAKQQRLGELIGGLEEDERVGLQEQRYQRYIADAEHRRKEGKREMTFDDWAKQYEWRYDAAERLKMREQWPECFSRDGAAPLPVEKWEVDYLTHKEMNKIMYRRETAALGARRRGGEAPVPDQPEKAGFQCQLEVDAEDEEILKNAVVQKGYNYWW